MRKMPGVRPAPHRPQRRQGRNRTAAAAPAAHSRELRRLEIMRELFRRRSSQPYDDVSRNTQKTLGFVKPQLSS